MDLYSSLCTITKEENILRDEQRGVSLRYAPLLYQKDSIDFTIPAHVPPVWIQIEP